MNIFSSLNPIILDVTALIIILLVLVVMLMYIIAFIQGREISFWPPKIGALNNIKKEEITINTEYDENYFELPLDIKSNKKNKYSIPTKFLKHEKVTIMLWVFVPGKNELLRDAPTNRYLISHYTEEIDDNDEYLNQFCLRYTHKNQWEVSYSNNKGQYPNKGLFVDDALPTGWHHFIISWDLEEQIIQLLINCGKSGSDITKSFLHNWPTEFADKTTIGAWPTDYDGHYCETKLFNLAVVYDFLDIKNPIVSKHFNLKPKT